MLTAARFRRLLNPVIRIISNLHTFISNECLTCSLRSMKLSEMEANLHEKILNANTMDMYASIRKETRSKILMNHYEP